MNHSFYSADRATHLKIVVVGLMAAIMVSVLGISASVTAGDTVMVQSTGPAAVKAAPSTTWTSRQATTIR